jgi:hypothetical protein
MTRSVYFFCAPYESPEKARYQHETLCLAEGLRELGVPTFANLDYWRERPREDGFTLRRDPECRPADCDVVVFSNDWFEAGQGSPGGGFRAGQVSVYLNAADNWRAGGKGSPGASMTRELLSHSNAGFDYAPGSRPWAFGLSERILRSTDGPALGTPRSETVVVNHRLAHGVRVAAAEEILPRLQGVWEIDAAVDSAPVEDSEGETRLYWEQTGRRHYPGYYRRLCSAGACFAFGGYFAPTLSRNLDAQALRVAFKIVQALGQKTRSVVQFDSWRFWESLAAGCCTLHVDLDAYGCRLPVQPVNWKHYVGIDFREIDRDIRRLEESRSRREDIAAAGREWARREYSPRAVAERFLSEIEHG